MHGQSTPYITYNYCCFVFSLLLLGRLSGHLRGLFVLLFYIVKPLIFQRLKGDYMHCLCCGLHCVVVVFVLRDTCSA